MTDRRRRPLRIAAPTVRPSPARPIRVTSQDKSRGILLIGHGTRNAAGIAQFYDLCQCVAERLAPVPVEPAFLELQQPDIGQAVSRLIERGCRRLTVLPLLLFAAGHAKRDIPSAVQAAVKQSGAAGIEVRQAAHLGLHPAIVELSRLRGEQALIGLPPLPAEHSCLLLVGRGSGDESATAEMYEFARQRQNAAGGVHAEVAFVAMAQPLLSEQLRRLAASEFRRVIVQSHLLFEGDIADSIRDLVSRIAAEHSRQEWLLVPLLAEIPGQRGRATDLLVNVTCDRLRM